MKSVTASIVSHGHGPMVGRLAAQLLEFPEVASVVITENLGAADAHLADSRVRIVVNDSARGYGTNHNAALASAKTPFVCVLNPDLSFHDNPFPALLAAMCEERVAGAAPVVVTPDGRREDSARKFPTVGSLIAKAAGLGNGTYPSPNGAANPDWLAGMFLLMRTSAWREVGGFDEKYRLYYEDVDLCWRLKQRGYALRQIQKTSIVHDARRASRSDWRHARWHLASMARFLTRSAAH